MPFESVYLEYKNANELSMSGFKEFPFVVPRYLKHQTNFMEEVQQ